MFSSHIWLALGWTAYGVLHSLLADKKVKKFIRDRSGTSFRYYRSFYNLIAFLLLAALIYWLIRIPTQKIWMPVLSQYFIGGAMVISGIAGMVIVLKKYFVTSAGFRDLFYEGGTPKLVVGGLHRIVRHPLYLSTFLFLWGLLLLLPVWSLLVTNLVITLYTIAAIRLEEKKLVEIFGEEYINYRKTVPMIWPRMK
jgi:methanethiol S-methyltransferase